MNTATRQGVAVLALVGVLISVYLLLYKLGAFGTLVCATGGCETVQHSRWAVFLGLPVAAWGVAGYGAILVTALLGTRPRFATETWVSWGLLGLTGGALLFSVYLSLLEEFVIEAWCQWCIASAVIALLAFGLALPEIRAVRSDRAPDSTAD